MEESSVATPEQLKLMRKVTECTNRYHRSPGVHQDVLNKCNFWHDEEERRILINGKNLPWTPARQAELRTRIEDNNQEQRKVYSEAQRAAWIAKLKERPNYKTKECRNPDRDDPNLHDHETCAFHHGYDFNVEAADRLAEEARVHTPASLPTARGFHRSERRMASQSRFEIDYESAFPALGQ